MTELGEAVTSRWKGLGWVAFQEYLGMLWQVVWPVQDAFLWAGALHPELGQWVHAGTSCHLSRCHHIMLWGEGFGGARCCWKRLFLSPFSWEQEQLLWIFRALVEMCQSSLVLLSLSTGAIPDPRAAGSQQERPAGVGCPGSGWHRGLGSCSQEHREAEDGARLLQWGAGG